MFSFSLFFHQIFHNHTNRILDALDDSAGDEGCTKTEEYSIPEREIECYRNRDQAKDEEYQNFPCS